MDKLINTPRKTIQVAVGIISNCQGQLLIAKRPDHWLGGGFWEFPGGKLELNENSETALKRELLEEVGIVVQDCSPLINLTYEYPERTVVLNAWIVHSFTGTPAGLEGQEIAWQDRRSLNDINMLPANRAIVIATQLPDTYLITPEYSSTTHFLSTLEKMLRKQQIKMLQLRSKQLSLVEYTQLAQEASALCSQLGVSLLLNHENRDILEKINADGIHLRAEQLDLLTKRPLDKHKWVGASCHNFEQIQKAEQIGVDFIAISPVQPSPFKSAPLGWGKFSNLVKKANIPVYALGGMTINDLALAKEYGAQGIAGVRCFWR